MRTSVSLRSVLLVSNLIMAAYATPAFSQESFDPTTVERIVTPNAFQGSDVERINQAIEYAAPRGLKVVVPRINENPTGEESELWLLDSAILVRDDTFLELNNCRIKLSDQCRDNMIRSANCGLGITDIETIRNVSIVGVGDVLLEGADHPRATGDSAKTLGQRTYGSDAGVEGESQTGDWRNIGVLLAHVECFRIKNLRCIATTTSFKKRQLRLSS